MINRYEFTDDYPHHVQPPFVSIFEASSFYPLTMKVGRKTPRLHAICGLFGFDNNRLGFDLFRLRQRDGQDSIIEISLCLF